MQNRDILWAISMPFRMFDTKELSINKFVFTLSFDAALCNVSTARRIVTIGLEKGLISKVNGANYIRIEFEFWSPLLLPPDWKPEFDNLKKGPMIDLLPLDKSLKYEPKFEKKEKKSESLESERLYRPKHIGRKVGKPPVKKKAHKKETPSEKGKKDSEPKKKPSSKKKSKKTKKKQQGQKSISDFFR